MSSKGDGRRSWLDLLALILSFLAAIVTFWGAVFTYLSQAQIPEASLWPLPGWMLINWFFVAVFGFIVAFFCLRRKTVGWLRMTWFLTGAFIPLIILGAFSIGLWVFIAFFFTMLSTIFIAIRQKSKWLESFGFLMLGSIINLGILILIIVIANLGY
jgi:hypothetical protein